MRKSLLYSALALVVLLIGTVPAFAWTDLGPFSSNLGNWWDPNGGEMWGQIVRSGSRYLDADADLVHWDSGRVSQIQSQNLDPATVFHILKQNSNCGQSFNWTTYWWSNISGAYYAQKWADCVPWTSGPNNELRLYYPRGNMVGDQNYDVGGEFTDQGGGSLDGEVDYDTYYGSNKDNHAKWCFNSSDGIYPVNAQGRCY